MWEKPTHFLNYNKFFNLDFKRNIWTWTGIRTSNPGSVSNFSLEIQIVNSSRHKNYRLDLNCKACFHLVIDMKFFYNKLIFRKYRRVSIMIIFCNYDNCCTKSSTSAQCRKVRILQIILFPRLLSNCCPWRHGLQPKNFKLV